MRKEDLRSIIDVFLYDFAQEEDGEDVEKFIDEWCEIYAEGKKEFS
jgi:hypothetical protein